MNTIEVKSTIFKNKCFEYKKGDTLFWLPSIYSESWQSWTIQIYIKTEQGFKSIQRLTQKDFYYEIDKMQKKNEID